MAKYSPSPECMAQAKEASGDKLTREEIEAAFQKVHDYKQKLQATGQIDGLADKVRSFAEREAERAKIVAAMQKRHAALNILVRDRLDAHIETLMKGGLSPKKALLAILEGTQRGVEGGRNSVDALDNAYQSRYIGGMMAELQARVPHMVHVLRDQSMDHDIMREMGEIKEGGKPGITGNKDAQVIAEVFAKYAELSRTDLNKLGASVGKLDGWAGPQSHDDMKMIAVGKDAWIDAITPHLDIDRTFPDMADLNEVKEALGDIYDTLITGFPNKPTPKEKGQRVNPANLAKSLGKSRVLHFKDANAALDYRAKFGYGNTVSGMIGHLRRSSKIAANMDALGPNPEIMFGAIADSMKRKIKESTTLSDVQKQKQIESLNTDAGALRHALDISTGLISRPVNTTGAKIAADVRAVQAMAKLGGSVLSSMNDTITPALAAQFRGSGFMRGLVAQLDGLRKGRPKGQTAEISYVLGEGFDGLLGHIVSPAAANDGPIGFLSKMQETFFRWNGQSWWTDVNRAAAGRMISAEMGMRAQAAFKDLPANYSHVLGLHSIGEKEWNAIRQAAPELVEGNRYITPDSIRMLPDEAVHPLAEKRVKAERAALADRVTQRTMATDRDRQWAQSRKDKLDQWTEDANARLDKISSERGQRTEAQIERSKQAIELEKARIESARIETDLLESVRGLANQDQLKSLLNAVEEGKSPEKISERTDAIVEKILGRGLNQGEKFGAKRASIQNRIGVIEKKIADTEKSANATNGAMIERDRAAFQSRLKELKDFNDRAYSREQERIDANEKDAGGLADRISGIYDDARKNLELSVLRFVADETSYGVLEPDARTRRTISLGTRPGTVAGEGIRFIMQFKGFPIAFTQRVGGRAMYGHRKAAGYLERSAHIGTMLAGMTMAGYMSIVLKDMARDYWPPRDPTDPKTWGAAFVQGGAAGIYGDYLFSRVNRFGSDITKTAMGPTLGAAFDLADLVMKARDATLDPKEKVKMADFLTYGLQNTPFINMFYTRQALDFLFINSMREAASPGYLRKTEQKRKTDYRQTSFLPKTLASMLN